MTTTTPLRRASDRSGASAALTVREILTTDVLAGAEVLAGAAGLHRKVERLNVMEVPDILPWVKPHEFLLTTAYPLRDTIGGLAELLVELDRAGLAGLGIKLGRYIDRIPGEVLVRADECGFPLIRLPDEISFDDVLNEVLTGILNRQAQRLARSERIHRAFLDVMLQGHGLDRIIEALAELLDGPAMIVAPDGSVLSAARLSEVAVIDAAAAVDRVRWRRGRLCVGDAELACQVVAVSAGGRVHGHIVALGAADGELPDDRMALENAATVAALAMTKDLELQAVETKYQSDLMHDLLRGHVDDVADTLGRARILGWDLDRPLVAVVVRPEGGGAHNAPPDGPRSPLASPLQQPIRERDDAAACVQFSDEVVALTRPFDREDGRDELRRFGARLAQFAGHAGGAVAVGCSRAVDDLHAVPQAYEQAARALQIGRRLHGRAAVSHIDDLGIYRVLTLIDDVDELRRFAAETLGELTGEDPVAVDLRRTLTTLLDSNCNVAEAARRLHFHYNTLRYRIEKLERLIGPFTADPVTRINAHLALLILDMDVVRGSPAPR